MHGAARSLIRAFVPVHLCGRSGGLNTVELKLLESENLKEFLKERVKGPLKLHHEFRVSVSDCPNACSRPQIVDLGLIGALRPGPGEGACTERWAGVS